MRLDEHLVLNQSKFATASVAQRGRTEDRKGSQDRELDLLHDSQKLLLHDLCDLPFSLFCVRRAPIGFFAMRPTLRRCFPVEQLSNHSGQPMVRRRWDDATKLRSTG
jgi:hypothetical protein